MKRQKIDPSNLWVPFCSSWSEQGLLLTSGDHVSGKYNTMTVGWGGLGRMWKRPMAMVVVRPQRYTYQFMEQYPDFTLCHFPPEYSDALMFCGSYSGRDADKIGECGLIAIASAEVASPGFEQADLIVECRKMYFDDFEPEHFLAEFIEENYPAKDYHRIYLGEIKTVFATERYLR
jgi:flavin reductase (DIM6/NTAB) family NADH-FMN oxidoreductase RutF